MSPDPHSTDPALDRLLRAAGMHDEAGDFPVDENDLLAYLAGEADEETADRLRAALAASPQLRNELLEIAADHDTLMEIATTPAPWADREPARRASPLESLQRFMTGLFRQPALAAATFVFLLMAYPTFQYLSGDGESPLIQPARTLHLDAGGPQVRGDEVVPLPTIARLPAAALVTLSLWSDRPYAAAETVDLLLENDGVEAWRTAAWPVAPDPQAPERLDLRLDTTPLAAGKVTITVTRADGTKEQYLFDME